MAYYHSTSLSTTSIVLVSDVLYKARYEKQATLVELCYAQGHPAKAYEINQKEKVTEYRLRLLTFRDDLE